MFNPKILPATLVCSVVLLTGCTIARKVESAPAGTRISTIHVQKNTKVLMDGFHPELIAQLEGLGFQVESFEGPRPPEAVHMLTYTANWRWDMAMYLTYFQAMLLENNRILGKVEYDANMGGGRPDKFGRTSEKIRPLLIELLQNVETVQPTATSLGAP